MSNQSNAFFAQACTLMPGGVNSPVRAFKSVGGTPRFIRRGSGATVIDVDAKQYVDYVLSWGPLILGHAHPAVTESIIATARNGTSFGAPTELENKLAELIVSQFPSMDMIRFVNSGTEACMSALRLARAFTKRDKIIKFAGGYHGHADMLLAEAGSGVATFGLPDSLGVPRDVTRDTLVVHYNDLTAVETCFEHFPNDIAAVIVEPIPGNMGLILPKDNFLQKLEQIAKSSGSLLIFDEVMSGFRAHLPGVQSLYGIKPDLSCLGKVIGGGLPVAAYGGRKDIMQMVAPLGAMYQAGTLSGNPLGMAAGFATLTELLKPGVFEAIAGYATRLVDGLQNIASDFGVRVQTNCVGTMFGLFFLKNEAPKVHHPIVDYRTAKQFVDSARYNKFFHAMLAHGHYFAPSAFEVGFLSAAHNSEIVDSTLQAMRDSHAEWAIG